MRLPIAYCLGLPERLAHGWGELDFTRALELTFEPPDLDAFPAPRLAVAAARRGGAAPAWLNAANEVAVEAFLADRLSWIDIVPLVASVMDRYADEPLTSLEDLRAHDARRGAGRRSWCVADSVGWRDGHGSVPVHRSPWSTSWRASSSSRRC